MSTMWMNLVGDSKVAMVGLGIAFYIVDRVVLPSCSAVHTSLPVLGNDSMASEEL